MGQCGGVGVRGVGEHEGRGRQAIGVIPSITSLRKSRRAMPSGIDNLKRARDPLHITHRSSEIDCVSDGVMDTADLAGSGGWRGAWGGGEGHGGVGRSPPSGSL